MASNGSFSRVKSAAIALVMTILMVFPAAAQAQTAPAAPQPQFPSWWGVDNNAMPRPDPSYVGWNFGTTLQLQGFAVDAEARQLLVNPVFTWDNRYASTLVAKVAFPDLGLGQAATQAQMYERAAQKGLEICPSAVGPELRMSYQAQPFGEVLIVATKPLKDFAGSKELFVVANDGTAQTGDKLVLRTATAGGPNTFSVPWVFCKPHPTPA